MLHNLDTIYDIARSSNTFSTEINFSENFFWFTEAGVHHCRCRELQRQQQCPPPGELMTPMMHQ